MQLSQRLRAGRPWVITVGLMLVLTALATAQTIIVDNSDAGFTILDTQTWTTGTATAGHYGADYRYRNTTGFDGSTASQVEWRPNLPSAGNYQVSIYYPQGGNRANNAPFTVHYAGGNSTFAVNQQTGGGQWNILGTFAFTAGTSGSVSLSSNANASVVIADAVSFTLITTTVQLTMAVNPAGWGTTSPAVGGPYTKALNEVVPISATPALGYQFDHWAVSAGSAVANPTLATTTVTMDQSKTVTAVFIVEQPSPPEFRGFWADAFNSGFKSTAQIDAMVSRAVAGNYNAIVPEVLAYHDTGGSGHGAYWNSTIVPKASDITGGIDPLAYLVQQAHANGLEVHCWLVAFRASTTWPPAGNATVAAHPEWLMVRQADMNLGPLPLNDGDSGTTDPYTFDAGSPEFQSYLMSIVYELSNNYDIDGIHWDYIRYTQTNGGYPTDPNYANSSLKRFQRITGYSGTPPYSGNTSWNDFRRRTVTEVVRRATSIAATASNPRQPLRYSIAGVTWYPANSDFHQTGAYSLFSDWEYWQSMGYIDATIPMAYFDEQGSYTATYRAWVTNSVNWANAAGRHTYIGPGIYMNSFANSVVQMTYARNAGAHGLNTYSYTGTNDTGTTWSDWYPYVATNFFTSPADVPVMPWRDPVTATQGTIYGRVTNGATGAPIDNANIKINGVTQVQTDGNGYYILTKLTAGASGTIVPVSAVATGYTEVVRPRALAERAGFTEINLALGSWLSGDYDVDGHVDWADFGYFWPALTGPNNGPVPAGADLFDFDADTDIDLPDFAVFQRSFTG
jgi:uncharacterized lipoprotein YddW (UPF0748 family)